MKIVRDLLIILNLAALFGVLLLELFMKYIQISAVLAMLGA